MSRPKVMLPIGNRPILQYVIESLTSNEVRDIILVVGYKKERIMAFLGDGSRFNARITYVVQDKQLGTAHAVSNLKGKIKGPFLVLPGDNIIDKGMVSSLLGMGEGNNVLVTESDESSKYGVVQMRGDKVVGIEEKPQQSISNIINTGLYSFDAGMLGRIEEEVKKGTYGLTGVLKAYLPEIDLRAIKGDGRWEDAVYPWDLVRLNELALEGKGQDVSGTIEPGVTIKGPVSIGKGTRIRSGCYIEGPVVIGEGCDIGPSVAIMPSTSIGDEANIDPFSMIRDSIIMSNVNIGPHSSISHSVIDDSVQIGPGFAANCGRASVRIENEWHDVPMVGIMVGEETVIGASVVVSAGTVIGSGCRINDGAKVSGKVENRSIVI